MTLTPQTRALLRELYGEYAGRLRVYAGVDAASPLIADLTCFAVQSSPDESSLPRETTWSETWAGSIAVSEGGYDLYAAMHDLPELIHGGLPAPNRAERRAARKRK